MERGEEENKYDQWEDDLRRAEEATLVKDKTTWKALEN